MYLYDGRVKVLNYGKLPNGAQLCQCLLVPPYGNKYKVPSCAVPLTSIITNSTISFFQAKKLLAYYKYAIKFKDF